MLSGSLVGMPPPRRGWWRSGSARRRRRRGPSRLEGAVPVRVVDGALVADVEHVVGDVAPRRSCTCACRRPSRRSRSRAGRHGSGPATRSNTGPSPARTPRRAGSPRTAASRTPPSRCRSPGSGCGATASPASSVAADQVRRHRRQHAGVQVDADPGGVAQRGRAARSTAADTTPPASRTRRTERCVGGIHAGARITREPSRRAGRRGSAAGGPTVAGGTLAGSLSFGISSGGGRIARVNKRIGPNSLSRTSLGGIVGI